jgi:hypothetical protein
MSLKNECPYCSRKYKIKKNYNNHIISCELFHKIQNISDDDYQDSIETLPNQRDIYKLLKILAIKCNVLEKEVIQMKKTTNIRQKKQIFELLNEKKMDQTFTNWYKEIEITEDDMRVSMEKDLTKGIIQIIKKKIENSIDNKPIACFKEKSNSIFIYDIVEVESHTQPRVETISTTSQDVSVSSSSSSATQPLQSSISIPSWRIATNEDINKLVGLYSHEILKIFVKWQKKHLEFFMANDKSKDFKIFIIILYKELVYIFSLDIQ